MIYYNSLFCIADAFCLFHAKDKVCDICGDIGEVGALTTCPQCKLGCEHRYCMRKPCMVVPVDWCCEICRSAKIVASSRALKKVTMEAVKCDLSSKVPHYPKESTQKMFSNGARSNWHEKPVERGKTKYLWTNEVKNMPSGDKKGKPKGVESNAILTPMKENRQMRQTSSVKYIEFSPAKKQKGMGETSRRKTCYIPKTDATLSPASALTSTVPTEDTVRTNTKLQKKISKELCADLLSFYCQPPMSGLALIRDVEPKNPDAENVVHTVEDFFIKAAAEESLPTDPAPLASWMGSFMLKDEKTSIGFRAHPTSQGLPKVKEFSKKMPEVLEFDLCPYKDFLRTVFKGYDPDEEDIGLYFFPDNMKRSMAYISHLEKLSEQYFMRSCIDGVELLVFTSKVLHKDYRMRNKYDFLWGIYRRRHGKKLKDAVEGTMVVDMDIDAIEVDMVAGETVGRVDVVVPGAYGISGAEANTIIYDDWGWAVGKRARLEEGIDVAGYHVSAEAMETLAPSRWIEDSIIHAYMTLLRQREQDIEDAPQWERKPSYFFADTFFMEFGKKIMYDFSQMNEEEAKKARPSVHKFFIDFATSDVGPAIHEVDYIFVAGHVDGNHWVLFVFSVKTWQVMVLDPKYDNMHYVEELKVMEFLVPEMLRFFRKGNHFSEGNAQCFLFRERPKQRNSDDCGIYIMKYMDYLLQGYDLTLVSWSTEDVETFRYRITMEIQKGKARPIPGQNMHNRLANSS